VKLSRVEKRTEVKNFDGLVTARDSSTLKNTEFQKLQNFVVTPEKILKKRPGLVSQQTATTGVPGGTILGRFAPTSGNDYLIFSNGLGVQSSIDNGKTWQAISGGPISAQWITQYNNLLYIVSASAGVYKWNGSGSASSVSGSPSGTMIVAFKDRLWVCTGNVDGSNTLFYSDVGPTGVETWGVSSFIKVMTGTRSFLQHALPWSDRLILFKTDSIHVLYPVGTVSSWSLRIMNPDRGASSNWGVRSFEGFFYFIAPDGFWRSDGIVFKEISADIRNLFDVPNIATAGGGDSYLSQFERYFYLFLSSGDFSFIYDVDSDSWATWVWNTGLSQFRGFLFTPTHPISSLNQGTDTVLVSTNQDPAVYRLSWNAFRDISNEFDCILRTAVMNFSLMGEEKRGKLLLVVMDGTGSFPIVTYGRDAQIDEVVSSLGSVVVTRSGAYRIRGPGYFRELEIQIDDNSNSPLTIWQWQLINQVRALVGQPVV